MAPYIYPKGRHVRRLKPIRVFPKYQTNKPILQAEFTRLCVYCRQPDSQARSQVYGIDHYAPKSIFPELVRDYTNLYYCCTLCNTYKRNYWHYPGKENKTRVLNPCDDDMAQHIRFDKSTGLMQPLTDEGRFFARTFRLNQEECQRQRLNALNVIDMATQRIGKSRRAIKLIDRKLASDLSDQERVRLQAARHLAEEMLSSSEDSLARMSGTLALPPLPAGLVA